MRRIILALLIIICSVVVIASFFMPWAKASTSATKVATSVKKEIAGPFKELPFAGKLFANLDKATDAINEFGDVELKTVVRGCDIPLMVNKKESKTAISLVQVFQPEAEGLDEKVLLIYLIPLLALACAALALLGFKHDIFIIIVALISGAISIGGLYKVMTTNISSNIVQITIGRGLWQTLYGYLLIFIFSIVWLITGMLFAKSKKGSRV